MYVCVFIISQLDSFWPQERMFLSDTYEELIWGHQMQEHGSLSPSFQVKGQPDVEKELGLGATYS